MTVQIEDLGQIAERMAKELYEAGRQRAVENRRFPTWTEFRALLKPIRQRECRWLAPKDCLALADAFALAWDNLLERLKARQ